MQRAACLYLRAAVAEIVAQPHHGPAVVLRERSCSYSGAAHTAISSGCFVIDRL